MNHLKRLHESFIDKARRPMSFGKLPIAPLASGAAIIPVDRWETVDSPKRLHKAYKFISNELRNAFVEGLFDYEKKVGHNAKLVVEEYKVTLDVYTKDIDQITELDKEYTQYADVLFKDIVYNAAVENEL
jgi:pterin-4a-carbinolamine dehydratase